MIEEARAIMIDVLAQKEEIRRGGRVVGKVTGVSGDLRRRIEEWVEKSDGDR